MARVADEEYRCFVGGLSWSTDSRSLEDVFRRFGEITESRVVSDRETGRSRGFGFVTFATEDSMRDAIDSMNGKELDGRLITVNEAQTRSRGGGGGSYRSGGGGYGGGGNRFGGSRGGENGDGGAGGNRSYGRSSGGGRDYGGGSDGGDRGYGGGRNDNYGGERYGRRVDGGPDAQSWRK